MFSLNNILVLKNILRRKLTLQVDEVSEVTQMCPALMLADPHELVHAAAVMTVTVACWRMSGRHKLEMISKTEIYFLA